MALRFIGIDPDTDQGNCPAVWIDDEKKEVLFQGWKPDEGTKALCATASPLPETEGIVRVPYRMIELIRKACDEAEGS
ncbi:hypothetical protein [Streptomyces varsoviensis]|uniref:Uncharacterized protein n=2 Tax=Streptomyces varsoviensis TaxID=67373 RepID=A0ABR5J7A6_9ACTN|nr:hypothetical protein [Streptomyces varsoviensis]KOG89233.1 hypothetical protein ADK38_15425 [Streptomyces varsoviensis]